MSQVTSTAETASKPLYIRTPLVESLSLSQLCGCDVLLKLENTQPSGSFKIRGIGHFLQTKVMQRLLQNTGHRPLPTDQGNATTPSRCWASATSYRPIKVMQRLLQNTGHRPLPADQGNATTPSKYWASATFYRTKAVRQVLTQSRVPRAG